jgi:ribonuclease HI
MRQDIDIGRIDKSLSKIKVFTDGASRGNPGVSGIGIVIYDENNFILSSWNEYLGLATNNQAEYKALLKSLTLIKKLLTEIELNEIEFYSDSLLMVSQINFDYKINEPELALLNNKFHVLIKKLNKSYKVIHIERSLNKAADRLANQAIDNRKSL